MKRSDHYHRQMVEAAQRRRRLALWLETYEAMTATRAWHRDPAGFVDGVATHERPVFAFKKSRFARI